MVFVSPSCENLDPTDEELVDEIEEGCGLRIHGWLVGDIGGLWKYDTK